MDLKKAIGDKVTFVPLHKLVFFSTDATVGEVLDELSKRKSSLCLVRHATGLRLTTVPRLLRIASAHAKTSDKVSSVALKEILSEIEELPAIDLRPKSPQPATIISDAAAPVGMRRSSGGLRPQGNASPTLTDIARHGYGYIRVDNAPKGLAMSADYAAAAMVSASYWICQEARKKHCISADEPRGLTCVPHSKAWDRKH